MNDVAFAKQKFGEICAVLAGYPSDQCGLGFQIKSHTLWDALGRFSVASKARDGRACQGHSISSRHQANASTSLFCGDRGGGD